MKANWHYGNRLRAGLGVWLSVTVVLSAVLALGLAAPPAVNAKPASELGAWVLQWSDEFNGAGALNTANWLYDLGTSYPGGAPNWGTGEVEVNTNSTANVNQTGGHLEIIPVTPAQTQIRGGLPGALRRNA